VQAALSELLNLYVDFAKTGLYCPRWKVTVMSYRYLLRATLINVLPKSFLFLLLLHELTTFLHLL